MQPKQEQDSNGRFGTNMENKMHYYTHFGLKPKLETKMRLVHSCISCVSRIKLHYVIGKE